MNTQNHLEKSDDMTKTQTLMNTILCISVFVMVFPIIDTWLDLNIVSFDRIWQLWRFLLNPLCVRSPVDLFLILFLLHRLSIVESIVSPRVYKYILFYQYFVTLLTSIVLFSFFLFFSYLFGHSAPPQPLVELTESVIDSHFSLSSLWSSFYLFLADTFPLFSPSSYTFSSISAAQWFPSPIGWIIGGLFVFYHDVPRGPFRSIIPVTNPTDKLKTKPSQFNNRLPRLSLSSFFPSRSLHELIRDFSIISRKTTIYLAAILLILFHPHQLIYLIISVFVCRTIVGHPDYRHLQVVLSEPFSQLNTVKDMYDRIIYVIAGVGCSI